MPVLDVTAVSGCCDLSEGLKRVCAEAASVMLERFHAGITQPLSARTRGINREEMAVHWRWPIPDAIKLKSHDNLLDATEYGAYAMAILAVFVLAGYRVYKRAQQSSGADWIMIPPGGVG